MWRIEFVLIPSNLDTYISCKCWLTFVNMEQFILLWLVGVMVGIGIWFKYHISVSDKNNNRAESTRVANLKKINTDLKTKHAQFTKELTPLQFGTNSTHCPSTKWQRFAKLLGATQLTEEEVQAIATAQYASDKQLVQSWYDNLTSQCQVLQTYYDEKRAELQSKLETLEKACEKCQKDIDDGCDQLYKIFAVFSDVLQYMRLNPNMIHFMRFFNNNVMTRRLMEYRPNGVIIDKPSPPTSNPVVEDISAAQT